MTDITNKISKGFKLGLAGLTLFAGLEGCSPKTHPGSDNQASAPYEKMIDGRHHLDQYGHENTEKFYLNTEKPAQEKGVYANGMEITKEGDTIKYYGEPFGWAYNSDKETNLNAIRVNDTIYTTENFSGYIPKTATEGIKDCQTIPKEAMNFYEEHFKGLKNSMNEIGKTGQCTNL